MFFFGKINLSDVSYVKNSTNYLLNEFICITFFLIALNVFQVTCIYIMM